LCRAHEKAILALAHRGLHFEQILHRIRAQIDVVGQSGKLSKHFSLSNLVSSQVASVDEVSCLISCPAWHIAIDWMIGKMASD
jgi:hypothetical protein